MYTRRRSLICVTGQLIGAVRQQMWTGVYTSEHTNYTKRGTFQARDNTIRVIREGSYDFFYSRFVHCGRR